MRCPYCLKDLQLVRNTMEIINGGTKYIYTCSYCGRVIPYDYIKSRSPKIAIGVTGFRGHGKTTYLSVLFYLLKRFPNYWHNGFSLHVLDEMGIELIYKKMKLLKNGQLPKATSTDFPDPVLVKFGNIPYLGAYIVSFFDISAGVPATQGVINVYEFLINSDILFLIFSIDDALKAKRQAWQDELERFLNVYLGATDKATSKNRIRKQHLIIVLTKADLFTKESPISLSDELYEYLENGSLSDYFELNKEKISIIKKNSKKIRKWLQELGAESSFKLVETNFKSVEYTIVSALGRSPSGNELGFKLTPEIPKRVLDPFLLALDKMYKNGIVKKLFG